MIVVLWFTKKIVVEIWNYIKMTTHLNEFIEWARENNIQINSVDPQYDGDNIDLKAITSTIGDDVQIVALSEGCHNNKVNN